MCHDGRVARGGNDRPPARIGRLPGQPRRPRITHNLGLAKGWLLDSPPSTGKAWPVT